MKEIEIILESKGITPTPVRKLVYKCLSEASASMSLSDMEKILESIDKSTISRTLSLFRNHHLLHSFNDGSGSVKYELCKAKEEDIDDDTHVHFRCEQCGDTICLSSIRIPEVILPEGYSIHEVNYIITGICGRCSNRYEK